MKNPLLDSNFLHALDANRNRITYARITSLTLDNLPVERIEGVFTGGSITIDGSSAVRRICNLTMTTKNLNMNNIYWGLTTRVKVEIGLENNLTEYKYYPDIIWFPQGVYIITDFKTSNQVNSYTITLSGKDKMCLLNGDVGGNFNAETDCGTIDWQDDEGKWHPKEKLTITQIIYNLVHEYAQETDDNIIIKDIEKGLEILRNNSKNNIYIIERRDTQDYIAVYYKETLDTSSTSGITLAEDDPTDYSQAKYIQFVPDGIEKDFYFVDSMNMEKPITDVSGTELIEEKVIPGGTIINFNDLEYITNFIYKPTTNEDDIGLITADPYTIATNIQCYIEGKLVECVVLKIAPQEDVGYKMLDVFYPDELIAAPGETVVSIFDKIVKAFGVYEYFYDIQGRFIFQAKETYVNTAWNAIVKRDDETYIDPSQVNKYVQYNFEGSNLTTAYQNSPNMGNIKNDYTVWGKRKNSSGHDIPIHMRYAIDIKPELYRALNGTIYVTTKERYALLQKEIYAAQEPYRKHPLPDTLLHSNPSDWWHIEDWYECYASITGEYPLEALKKYQAKNATGFTGRLYFPDTKNPSMIVAVENRPTDASLIEDNVWYIGSQPIFIFDMVDDFPAPTNMSPFQHRFNSCGHTLQWFLEKMKMKNYNSYVYQPYIPLEDSGDNAEIADIINSKQIHIVDWREIIFQMAKDYYAHHLEDDFRIRIRDNNIFKTLGLNLFPKGKTGYEQYYHDIEGFWRCLYLPSYVNLDDETTRGRIFNSLKPFDLVNENDYYNEDTIIEIINKSNLIQYEDLDLTLDEIKENYKYNYLYWNKKVFTDPAMLYFWFDFFNAESLGLGQFSVPAIGARPKVINNDKVKAIIYKGIPNIIFSADNEEYEEAQKNFTGYTHFMMGPDENGHPGLVTYEKEMVIQQSGIDTASGNATETKTKHTFQLLTRSNRSITAQEEMDDLVYNFSYCNETVTINTVPIYYLEPNTIISAKDEQRVVNGYYIMNKITVPLTYNGTTSITAIKVPERIY